MPAEAAPATAAAKPPVTSEPPTPEKGPAPEPAPPVVDWPAVAQHPALWPAETQLKTPVEFPISVEGKTSGATRIPAGANVKVVKIAPDSAEVAFAEYTAVVAFEQTSLAEQLEGVALMEPPPETAPVRKLEKPPEAAEAKPAGTQLSPQPNWQRDPGDERIGLIELIKVLNRNTVADKSPDVTEFPEITRGVTLMMPIREALVKLGLSPDLIPSKSPIPHPGIPFFYRSFPFKYALIGDPDDYFNIVYIITDADDHVVAIQFVCESPRSKLAAPKDEFLTYNFIVNRRKASTTLKVGCTVKKAGPDVLEINSWLYDERRGKTLEIDRLYLPNRIANFLRYVIEARLDLVE